MVKDQIILDGNDIQTLPSFNAIENSLIDIIAEASIWVRPENISMQPVYPNVKRGIVKDKGKTINGIRIDDNTYANAAIKRAVSKSIKFENYMVCHIWPGTTYNERYHTLLPNLVLIPSIIANLSDYYSKVIDVLKYRSWELYGWYPDGEKEPSRPSYYPTKWRPFITEMSKEGNDTISSSEKYLEQEEYEQDKEAIEIEKVNRKIPHWINRPNQINSHILRLYMELSKNDASPIHKDQFKEAFEQSSAKPFDSNYNQMKNFGRKNHAKVFSEDNNGYIRLWHPVSAYIKDLFIADSK